MVVLEDVHIHGQKAQALQDSGFLCYLISIMAAVGRALQNLLCFRSESSSSAYKQLLFWVHDYLFIKIIFWGQIL